MHMNAAIAAAILAFTSSALAYYPSEANALYARDAYADYEDYNLMAREAEPEFDDDDFASLQARYAEPEAYPEAFADAYPDAYPEAYPEAEAGEFDDGLDIHPRDAYEAGFEQGLLQARDLEYEQFASGEFGRRAVDTAALKESANKLTGGGKPSKSKSASKDDSTANMDSLAAKSNALGDEKARMENLLQKDTATLEALKQKQIKEVKALAAKKKEADASDKEAIAALTKEFQQAKLKLKTVKKAIKKKNPMAKDKKNGSSKDSLSKSSSSSSLGSSKSGSGSFSSKDSKSSGSGASKFNSKFKF